MWELGTQPRSPFCLVSLGDPRHLPMASVSQPQRGSQAAPSSAGRGTRAVEAPRKGRSQEELSKGVAELKAEALGAGIRRELGAVPGPGASLAEALDVVEEFGGEVLGPGKREKRSGWLSEPPGFLTVGAGGEWMQGLWDQVGLGFNPAYPCFTEGPW